MTDERLGFEVVGRYEGEAELKRLSADLQKLTNDLKDATTAARRARLVARLAKAGLTETPGEKLSKSQQKRVARRKSIEALRDDVVADDQRKKIRVTEALNKQEIQQEKEFIRARAENNRARVRLAKEIEASEKALERRSLRAVENSQKEIQRGIDKNLNDEQRTRTEQNAARVRLAKELAATEQALEKRSFQALERSQREIQKGIDERRRETERVAKAEERLARNQNRISEFSRRWLFTLRRVVLVYGAIRAAQLTITGLNQALISSLTFGNELERAPKAIAGIAAATFDVRDAMGNLLPPTEAYSAALGQARKQLEGLKADAIGSASTFEELQENFLTAIGPGSVAGFSLDEIRRFTVTISEIAAVTGQAQNQLAEEIRALFTGDIRAKDSRIARNLGISSADIKRVREAGTQVEFLDQKFAAFKESTKELQNTLPRVLSDLKDAARLAAAEGMEPLRLELAAIGREIRDLAIEETEGGVIIDPRFASAIKPIAKALAEFARNMQDGAGAAATLAIEIVRLGAELLALTSISASVFAGLSQVFIVLLRSISLTVKTLRTLLDAIPDGVKQFVGFLFSIRVLGVALAYLPLVLGKVGSSLVYATKLLLGLSTATKTAAVSQGLLAVSIRGTTRVLLLLARSILIPLAVLGGIGLGIDAIIDKFEILRTALVKTEAITKILFNKLFGDDNPLQTLGELGSGKGLFFQKGKPFEETFTAILDSITSGTDKVVAALGLAGDTLEGASLNARIEDILAFDDVEQGFRDSLDLQGVRLDFAAAADAGGELAEVFQIQLQLAEDEALALQEVNREITKRQVEKAKLNRGEAKDAARLNVLAKELETLEIDRSEVARLYTDELKRQVSVLELRNRLTAGFAIKEAEIQRQLSESQSKLTDKNVFRDELSEYFEQLARLAEARVEVERIQAAINAAAQASLDIQKRIDQPSGTTNDAKTLVITASAEEQIRIRNGKLQQIELQTAKNIVTIEEQKLEELERQFKARTGINNAIKEQIRDLQSSANFERFASGASDALRTELSGAVLDSFDPRTLEKVDFGVVTQNIGIDIARALGQALLDEFIFRPLFEGLGKLLDLDLANPGQTAQITATQANTSNLAVLNTGIPPLTSAISILTSTISSLIATILSQPAASAVSSVAVPVGALFVGGGVQGGALGGPVSGPVLASAPPGLDPRDRIPIMTRQGEYIVTPEMDRKEPGLYRYLEFLRRRTHGLSGVGKLPPSFAMRDSFKPRGFATGGSVSNAASSSGSSRNGVTVLPVLVRDSREIDRIVASPSFVRGATLHRSTLRMIQNSRSD